MSLIPDAFFRNSCLQLPDDSISALYSVDNNYILEEGNLRSPKSLVDLCVDTLCRSLPFLDGELPAGLPPDVVDDIVKSLMKHSALNANTIRSLKNCELESLILAGCRGVSDEWLRPFSQGQLPSRSSNASLPLQPPDCLDPMDFDEYRKSLESAQSPMAKSTLRMDSADSQISKSSRSTSSFLSAASTPSKLGAVDDAQMDQSVEANSPASSLSVEELAMNSPSQETSASIVPSSTSNLKRLDLRGSQNVTDRGLLLLSNLGSLEVALLDHCHSIVGRGLVALASAHRLHTLSLAHCRRLTDEAVINISHLLSLEALSLDGCRCITDRSLAAIANLYELRKLDLSQCDLVTNEGVEQLHDLEFLEELSLGWCRQITDTGLHTITEQPGRPNTLRILRLARCRITDEGIRYLGRLRVLEELDLNGCANISSAVLGETLGKMPKLSAIDVSYCPGIL